MPTYDYLCGSCEYRFEVFEGMTSKPLKKCPKCGGKATRQLGAGIGGPKKPPKNHVSCPFSGGSGKPALG